MGDMVGAIVQIAGTAIGMYGDNDAARAKEREALFRAAQYRQAAGQTQASAQREAETQRRMADRLSSRALALAGGGAGDVSVIDNIADITAEGELRSLTALFEGDSLAQDLRLRADNRVFEAVDIRSANNMKAAGTIFESAGSLYSKYGGKGSPTTTSGGEGWDLSNTNRGSGD